MITPTTITTSPIKFTAPEKARLQETARELARLDGLLDQVVNLKEVIGTAAEDFAAGRIDLKVAASLLSASGDSTKRAELEGTLRRPVKTAIKQAVESVADLIGKTRAHHVAELAAKASALEKAERSTITDLGMSQDDFAPSDLLLGLREQHRRAAEKANQAPGRDELNRILAAE